MKRNSKKRPSGPGVRRPLSEREIKIIFLSWAAPALAGVAVAFALIFKYVPETRVRWKDVWEGAIATAFLFTIGKSLIGLYLGKATVESAYGAAGSLVVIVLWVYYSAIIFLFGAEFTHVLAKSRGIRKDRGMDRDLQHPHPA